MPDHRKVSRAAIAHSGKRHRRMGRGRKARPKTERRAAAGGRFAAGAPRRERGEDAVFRDEATRRGSAANGAGGRTLPPVGRDEGETYDPSAKTCHARAISPPTAERTASGRARIRQDSPLTAYMHTPSRATDAEAASPGAGVPLRRNRPHADKTPDTDIPPASKKNGEPPMRLLADAIQETWYNYTVVRQQIERKTT